MHAAGVLRDALLADQTDGAFDEVWQPKVAGAMNLHNTVVNDLGSSLDLFVMFSSVTALLGNAGQANYAAANAVLDALATRRRSVGLCGTSIQWGAWAETGMAVDAGVVSQMWSQGMRGIRNDEGLDALDVCVAAGQPAVLGVVPVVKWGELLGQRGDSSASGVPSFLKQLADHDSPAPTGADPSTSMTNFLASLIGQPRPEQLLSAQAMVIRVVKQVSYVEVGPDDALQQSGVDSLAAVEVRNGIQDELGDLMVLSNTIMFDYPTASAMAAHVVDTVAEKLQVVDEDVSARAEENETISAPTSNAFTAITTTMLGTACYAPGGCETPAAFWQMLCSGRHSIQKIPVARFDVDALDGTDAELYVKRGHFVQGVEQFDNAFFGMGSAEAGAIDPHHRVLLEVGYSALYDGGYESKGDLMGTHVGVFLGFATSSEWGFKIGRAHV